MTDALRPKQALLIFKLLFLGCEEPYVLSKMKPQLLGNAAERQELLDRGLLRRETRPEEASSQEVASRKKTPEKKPKPVDVLVPTDKAWDWLAGHIGHALPVVPSNQAHISKLYGKLFPTVLQRLACLVARERIGLAEFVMPELTLRDEGLSDSLEDEIYSACRGLSDDPLHACVRVGAVQDVIKRHSWQEVNEALTGLALRGKLLLHPCNTPTNLTRKERERAAVFCGVPCHTVTMELER